MRAFLKEILKKNTVGTSEVAEPINTKFKVESGIITYNNACETIWEFKISVPDGTTATFVGTIYVGYEGSGNPGPVNGGTMILGTVNNVSPGIVWYSVNLGNSNSSGNASTYRIDVTLSDLRSQSVLFQRTSAQSFNYDKAPC